MFNRKIVIASAAIVAFSPLLANASQESESMSACARALATSVAAPSYKINNQSHNADQVLPDFSAEYTWVMEAKNSKTGAPLAKVRCSTDMHGSVTSIAPIVAY